MSERLRLKKRLARIIKLAAFSCAVILAFSADKVPAQGFDPDEAFVRNLIKDLPQYPPAHFGISRERDYADAQAEHGRHMSRINAIKEAGARQLDRWYNNCITEAQDPKNPFEENRGMKKCQEKYSKRANRFGNRIQYAYDEAEDLFAKRLDAIGKYWDRRAPSVLRIDGRDGVPYSRKVPLPPKDIKSVRRGTWKKGTLIYH